MPVVLGVDSSTQSTKVEARDLETGEVVATGSAPHPATTPPVSEQRPEAWWDALVAAVGQLGDHRRDVVSVAVAGQQHGLVMVDKAGDSVRPAMLWNDTRSAEQAAALVERLGAPVWAEGCGSVPVAAFTVAKLAWVGANEPGLADQVDKVMLPHDYLTWRLSGAHVTDRGDASGTGWFDARSGNYDPTLLAAATGDGHADDWLTRLPNVLGPSEAAGTITAEAAGVLGLEPTVLVGPGTGDNMGAALGLGLKPGDVAVSLGTSGTVYSVSTEPTADTTGEVAGFADANGQFLPLVCTLNATKVTDTVAGWLGTDAPGLSELALAAPQDFDGEILVPYFDGERTPNLPNASGAFHGLRTTTSREALARAAHDGVLCGLLTGLDSLRREGVATDGRLHLIGGGSRSGAYRQRAADLHGDTVLVPDTDETVATGAAVIAASILDGGPTATETTDRWNLGVGTLVEPSHDGSAVRDAYRTAADAIAGTQDELPST